MRLRLIRYSVSVVGVALTAVLAFPVAGVSAATTGPTVIAVHQNGAVDVSGNNTFGNVARMSVPAGNWMITATGTIQGTTSVGQVECQLVAGTEFYKARTQPSGHGVASSQPVVLLLGHHFAKTGVVILKCYSDGVLGDVLIRDIHVAAVKVAQLTTDTSHFGSGSPAGLYSQNTKPRGWTNNGIHDLQELRLPAGTWLVQAVAWGASGNAGDRIDCSLDSFSATVDQSFGDFETVTRGMSLEGVISVSAPNGATLHCKDAQGLWFVDGTAISAIQVGTLKYGQIGGTQTTAGSGSPTVVGGYGGPGGIDDGTSLASIGSISLGAGSWFVTSRLSLQAGATATVRCQLQVASRADQGRVYLDTGNDLYNWLEMSLTRKLSSTAKASVVCNQSGGPLGAGFFDLKIFALKAGSLTDTDLD
jgi:hypothetical protein